VGRHRADGEGRRRWLCGSLAALAAGLAPRAGLAWWGTPARAAAPVARRETRPTLDPARFVGKARSAHQVARDAPDVLDQLYCYCECDRSIGHKSLLSCYTDGHAAT
jgi:hypothetical protein